MAMEGCALFISAGCRIHTQQQNFQNIMYLNKEAVVKNASIKRNLFRCIEKGIIRKSKGYGFRSEL